MTTQSLLEQIKKDKISLIELQFSDFFGTVKSLTITVDQLSESLDHGTWFDGSSIEGFARIYESDMVLKPDLNSYRLLPWFSNSQTQVSRLICDVYTPDGKPFPGSPRNMLKQIVQQAQQLGYTYNVGPELEFFLFKRDEHGDIDVYSQGNGDYFALSMDESYTIKQDIITTLEAMGIYTETSHYEVAHNQHEIDFRYSDAVTTADNAMTFKYVVKSIAAKHGYYASFMPKPIAGVNGSGMHVHQSLANKQGKNLFAEPQDKYGLSETAYNFMAGQLKYIQEIASVIAPTVNSYKRLTPGFEAPVYACWARRNRSALIRIPQTSPGREASTRVELRCPDPSANPYLAFAAMLKAGLKGIEEQLPAPDPVEENLFELDEAGRRKHRIVSLPGSLDEALWATRKGTVLEEVMGQETYHKYLEAKQAEWDDFRTAVTEWELDRYLETV